MFSELLILGKDPEVKMLPSGTQLVEISGAYRLAQKDQSGNHLSQWVRVACFGKKGEVIAQHFKKGSKILAHMDNVRASAYINQHGQPAASMDATLVEFAFVEAKQQGQQQYQQPPAQQPAPAQQQYQQPPAQQQAQQPVQPPPAQQYQQQAHQQPPAQQQQSWGNQAQPNQFEQPPF